MLQPLLSRAAKLAASRASVHRCIRTGYSTTAAAGDPTLGSRALVMQVLAAEPACGRRRSQRLLGRAAGAEPSADAEEAAAIAAAAGAQQQQQPVERPAVRRRRRAAASGDSLAELDLNQPQLVATDAVLEADEGAKAAPKRGRAAKAAAGPTRAAEQQLWERGHKAVAGVDEAGRGPLAGPVVAAACIIPADVHIPGIDDSKKMSEAARDALYDAITGHSAIKWAACVVDAATIDRINILQAAMQAMTGAVQGLDAADSAPGYILVDGNRVPSGLAGREAHAIVKGDGSCYCIAAASIIAKVTRDRLMLQLHEEHPQYGFAQHKGYGVPAHMAAITKHGPCSAHRRSFEPVKSILGWSRTAS